MLDVREVTIEYPAASSSSFHAVTGVSLHVDPGELVGLVGDSGCGKSTLLLAILGLTRHGGAITGGSITFQGNELVGAPRREIERIRGREIGLVTQSPKGSFDPLRRIGDQIALAVRTREELGKRDARRRTVELLHTVGISDPERRAQAFPHELSGGMAQRALIAMALAGGPKLLLADEPTSGLDVTLQARILDDLRAAAEATGTSLLLVTHDSGVVVNYTDRVYLMNAGEVVESVGTVRMFTRPAHPAALAMLAVRRPELGHNVRLGSTPIDRRSSLPSGCYLHPRCPFAAAEAGCMTVHPELVEIEDGHATRCHRWPEVRAVTAGAGERAPA